MSKKVLLTGVSGYVGLHCVKTLLEKGYHVTGSVRNKSKQQEVISTLNLASVSIEHLSFTHLDLNSDKGWDEALSNCDYVMHVASPFTIENPKNESEMFAPAIDGTLRVLKFAKKNGVKRVVLTSSTVAIMGGRKTGKITPEDWTDLNSKNLNTYFKSKTLAEQAAWNFLLKILSVFNREAKGMLTMLGMNLSADNSKTMDVFDWKPIPFEKTVLDTAKAVKKIIAH